MAGDGKTIQGTVASVRETWPLQLVIDTSDGRYEVVMAADAEVTSGVAQTGVQLIKVGSIVRVFGNDSTKQTIKASRIEVMP